jgi:hypothetical protein
VTPHTGHRPRGNTLALMETSQRRYSIFISHSTKDKAFVEKLKVFLDDHGVDAWLDNYEIIKGQSIPKRIEDGITASDYFGPVLTPSAVLSPWVDHEIDIALYIWISDLRRARVFIIPLFREECSPRKGVCYQARVDFRDDAQFTIACDELIDAIRQDAASGTFKEQQETYVSSTPDEKIFKQTITELLAFAASSYIPRRVIASDHHREYYDLFANEFQEDLLGIILRSKRVALLADAGKGKTLEIQRVAHELATRDLPFIPIYASLNKYSGQSLDSCLPDVKRFDDTKLVLLLDGFDEIQGNHRENAVNSILQFADQHPNSRIVLSSRTNLFQNIAGFEIYHLVDLNGEAIKLFIKTTLGKAAPIFEKAVAKVGLADWLHHPFYLTRLVEMFLRTGAVPDTNMELIETLIEDHLAKDDEKYPESRRRRPDVVRGLDRLALTMEILARNYLTEEEFHALVPAYEDRASMLRSGLIRKVEGEQVTLQFEHNSFQEFIAARIISRHGLDIIRKVTAFAPDFTRIKPSWSNTLAFVFSHLAANRDELTAFLRWMKLAAPDLLVKCEPDRIDLSQRLDLFASIFEDCRAKRVLIRGNVYTSRDLGKFADSKEAVEYLLKQGGATKDSTVLANTVDILRFMTIPYSLHKDVLKFLMSIVERGDKESQLTAHGLLALADLDYAQKETVAAVVRLVGESSDTWIRSFLYYFLRTSGAADDYIKVFLDGLKYVRMWVDDKEVRLGDEAYHLKEGLESVKKPEALQKILEFFAASPAEINGTFMTDALRKVVENAGIAFDKEPSLYDYALRLFLGLHSKHQEKEAEIVRGFFDLTATRKKAFDQVFSSRKGDLDWYMPVASLLTEETTIVIADEYLAGRLPEEDIWRLRNFIGWRNHAIYDRYLEIVNEKTGNKFPLPRQRDYEAERKKRFKEDMQLLFDRDGFLESIKTIYVTERKDVISEDELHQVRMKRWDDPGYSELALQTLLEMVRADPKSFDQVRDEVLGSDWDFFAVSKIHEFMSGKGTIEPTEAQKSKIENWCYENLSRVDFRKALKRRNGGGTSADTRAILLWFFLRKLRLKYPEQVLLDMISFDWVDELQMCGIGYLEGMIDGKQMSSRVLQNLVDGIDLDDVLKNHIDYCARFKLHDVIPYALTTLADANRSEDVRKVALTAICTFDNTNNELTKLFLGITDNLRWSIARALMPRDQVALREALGRLLETGSDYEKARSSELLIELQDLRGLDFYVQQAKKGKQVPSDQFDGPVIRKIKTKEAVPLLMDLLEVTFDSKFVQDEYQRVDTAILDALTSIAVECDCYEEISATVKAFIDTNMIKFDNVRFLHNFLRTLERTYYMNRAEKYTLAEAAKVAVELVG